MGKNQGFLNKKQIAAKYCISRRTLHNIFKIHGEKIGKPFGYLFSPCQIDIIKSILGDFD